MEKIFPSRQFVRCPKRDCGKEVRKDRLNNHLLAIHGEKSYQISGQANLKNMLAKKQEVASVPSSVMPQPVFAQNENSHQMQTTTYPCSVMSEEKDTTQEEQASVIRELRKLKELQQANQKTQLHEVGKENRQILHEQSSNQNRIQYGIPTSSDIQKFFSGHTKKQQHISSQNNSSEITSHKLHIPSFETQPQPEATTAPINVENNCKMDSQEGEQSVLQPLDTQSISGYSETASEVRKKSSIGTFFSKFSFKKRKRHLFSPASVQSIYNDSVENKIAALDVTVQQINENICSLGETLKHLDLSKPKTASKMTQNSQIINAKLVLVRASKSVAELNGLLPEFSFLTDENKIECGVCVRDETETSVLKPIGIISYDFQVGSDFSKDVAPREFLNMKKKIVAHLESNHHRKCSEEAKMESEHSKKLTSRNYKVGLTLGLEAYKILKTGSSFVSYESDVSTLAAHGLDVGNINHSRKFASEFSKSVCGVLQERLSKILKEPLPATGRLVPISIVCDKLTPNRLTMQIVGIHGYIGSKFQSLVAGVPALSGNDGLSVTKCLRKGLDSLNFTQDELSTRLVGGAFDGEYFNLNIPNHLGNSLLLTDEQKKWYSYQWDPAHVLELAEKDAKKNLAPVKKIFSAISNVSKSFAYGKSFRELIEEAASEDMKARTPGHFSDTRFATYTNVVLKKFLHNYKFYYKIMNRNQDDDLDKVDNAHFIFSMGALMDTYEVIGKLSNNLQMPRMPHWVVKNICERHISKLNEMEEIFSSPKFSASLIENLELFPNLSKISREVSDSGEYQGCAILVKQHSVHLSRHQSKQEEYLNSDYTQALRSSTKQVGQFIKKFVANFSSRLATETERNPVLKYVDSLFDVSKIVLQEDDNCISVREALESYATLAKYAGALEDNIETETLIHQYKIFSNRVKDIAPLYVVKSLEDKQASSQLVEFDDIKIYEKMLQTEYLYRDIPDILHLALTGLSRSHCEAVVEGMGNVLGLNSQNRTSLNPKTVETETVIRWQGPHPSGIAKPLVELALDKHFKGRDKWHFCVSWDKSSHFAKSEVLTRIETEAVSKNKIPF